MLVVSRHKLIVKTNRHEQVIDITERINEVLQKYTVDSGTCNIFVTHTTAGLATGESGEGTDKDLMEVMEKIVPRINFRHMHNPSHAWQHMAASLAGASLTIPFENKRLILGTWQSVLLLEFNGPRERMIRVSIVS